MVGMGWFQDFKNKSDSQSSLCPQTIALKKGSVREMVLVQILGEACT